MERGVATCFEELHVYQKARELTNLIYRHTRSDTFSKDFGLVNQIRRAVISIMSNIAEGYERGSKVEFVQFLYIAKGSCGETRAQLQIAVDQGYLTQEEWRPLSLSCRHLSAMLSNFILHLQKSNYQGDKTNRPKRIRTED